MAVDLATAATSGPDVKAELRRAIVAMPKDEADEAVTMTK